MEQLKLFNDVESQPEFTNNDYETPSKIAQAITGLILPSDHCILEPCAGTGQIARHFPKDKYVDCFEIKPSRFYQGHDWFVSRRVNTIWYNLDFLGKSCHVKYHVVITNPPFNLMMEFVEKSLSLLDPTYPHARLLFLMPLDWNCTKKRSQQFKELDAHVHHVHQIPERIDYLINGVPCSETQKVIDGVPVFGKGGKPVMMSGRQCVDAVFDIRPGKHNAASSFLI
jgi:hypothetical protein